MIRTALLVTLTLATAVAAAEAPRSTVNQLESARQQVARAADRTKGGPRHLLLQEQQRIDGLIEDIDAGKTVDPAAINRSLQAAEHGPTW